MVTICDRVAETLSKFPLPKFTDEMTKECLVLCIRTTAANSHAIALLLEEHPE